MKVGIMRRGDIVTYEGQEYYRLRVNGYNTLYKITEGRVAYEDGYILEHRLVYEIAHGTKLPKGVSIHHINHNRSDNRPENLVALTQSEHAKLHAKELGKSVGQNYCIDCGVPITQGAKRCVSCSLHHAGRDMAPSKSTLERLTKSLNNTGIAKLYGVSNTTVGRWRKKCGLPTSSEQHGWHR